MCVRECVDLRRLGLPYGAGYAYIGTRSTRAVGDLYQFRLVRFPSPLLSRPKSIDGPVVERKPGLAYGRGRRYTVSSVPFGSRPV